VYPETGAKSRRTVLKTLRLPEELALSLEKEAEEEGTTLNALCSSALTKHVEWWSRAQKLGFISTSKAMFKSVLEATDDDRLAIAVRENMPTAWKDMAMFWFGNTSLDTMIRLFTNIFKYGWEVDMSIKTKDKEYTVVLSHELGPKFSLVLMNAIDELFRKESHIQPKFEVENAMVTVHFSVP
jgi:Lhr-like helicase